MRHHPLIRKILFYLLIALPLVGFIWWFRHTFALLISDANWAMWLTNKDTAGNILGSLLSGLLTVTAGVFTVIIYNRQSQTENERTFVAWLTDFNSSFHNDVNHSAVRLKLARERSWIRSQLIMEMLADHDLEPQELPAKDRPLCDMEGTGMQDIQWEFLRQFTDYLYFFEQLLALGEVLAGRGRDSVSATLVNHFGWFLRSLCMRWGEDDWPEAEQDKAADVFAIYLALNRYRRLAEVALLLSRSDGDRLPKLNAHLFSRVSAILRKQTPDLYTARTFKELQKKWRPIIGAAGFIGRGREDYISAMA